MTQVAAMPPSGCLWILIAFAVLIWIVVSCHPSSTPSSTSTSTFEDPAFPYDAFDKPRTYDLVKGSHTGTVNLRAGPGTEYGVIGTLQKDQTIVALGNATGGAASHWLVVRMNDGHIAYANRSILERRDHVEAVAKGLPVQKGNLDCTSLAGRAEQMICQDTALAKSDRTMAGLYAPLAAKLKGDDRANLVREQTEWNTERDQCLAEPDPKVCISQQYQTRILTLQLMAAQLEEARGDGVVDGSVS